METTIEKVKERSILFSTPMVIAVLDDRKDITRRVVKGNLYVDKMGNLCHDGINYGQTIDGKPHFQNFIHCVCPYGKIGDILWVRETFAWREREQQFIYKTDVPVGPPYANGNWKPSIFMPRKACRIKLLIKSITVERLHDITEKDAKREGIHSYPHVWQSMDCAFPDIAYEAFPGAKIRYTHAKDAFEDLWISINGKESWTANPWVWRIEFKKL